MSKENQPKRDPKTNTPRYILVTVINTKDRDIIGKAARSKRDIICKETSLRITTDLSQEIIKAQRQTSQLYLFVFLFFFSFFPFLNYIFIYSYLKHSV